MGYLEGLLNKGFVTPKTREIIGKYERECKKEELVERTIRQNGWTIERILSAMGKPIEKLTKDDLFNYFETLRDKKKLTYVNHQKATMKAFFNKTGMKTLYESITLLKQRKKNKLHELPKNLVDRKTLLKVLRACDSDRDKALVFFLYESGCRKSEALSMNVGDLVTDEYGFTAIVNGKTGQRRIRIIEAAQDIKNYLNNHPAGLDTPTAPLWCSLSKKSYGNRMNRDSLFRIFNRIEKRAKLEFHIYPHLLRHSRATELSSIFSEQQMDVFFGWEFGSQMCRTYIERAGVQIDDRLLEAQGIKRPEKKELKVFKAVCPSCNKPQSPASTFCYSCGSLLKTESAEKITKKAEPTGVRKEMEEMKADMKKLMEYVKGQAKNKD